MGNICRSPSAEGFFSHHLQRSELAGRVEADSAGTHSYHLGKPPDHRAIQAAGRFGVDLTALRARKVTVQDFTAFDRIVAMDRHNLAGLEELAPRGADSVLSLMMEYAASAEPLDVPDPYYGGARDFAYMCELLDDATRGLLRRLEEEGV